MHPWTSLSLASSPSPQSVTCSKPSSSLTRVKTSVTSWPPSKALQPSTSSTSHTPSHLRALSTTRNRLCSSSTKSNASLKLQVQNCAFANLSKSSLCSCSPGVSHCHVFCSCRFQDLECPPFVQTWLKNPIHGQAFLTPLCLHCMLGRYCILHCTSSLD